LPHRISVHVPFSRFKEFADRARRARRDLEFYFSAEVLDRTTDSDLHEAARLLDYSPRIILHSPFMDLSPGAVDPKVREVTLERYRQMIKAATLLNAGMIVFHSGYEKWKYSLNMKIWLDASVKTWEVILKETEESKIRIALENIFEDNPENLVQLMDAMNHPRLGLCFDTGHFNLFSTLSIEEWLDKIRDYIMHLHIHDNDRTGDNHAPPGNGTFPFKRFFAWLSQNLPSRNFPSMTLEAHSEKDALTGLKRLKEILPKKENE